MAESPATVAREAKNIHQAVKELLKTKGPFDKEVDFQRKNLRRRYLNLLLVHPFASESKDAENHLWMQTSYTFIAEYKQQVAALDRAIQNHRRQPQQQSEPQRQSTHGPVEHRKLLQKFRQFLSDEEKFWTQLVLRLHRSFGLTGAQPVLVALGLLSGTDDIGPNTANEVDTAHPVNGRNHFQFPPELPEPSMTAEERDGQLAILGKALVCLGDIARYRELYNEAKGRPPAGQEEILAPRRGRNRRGGAAAAAELGARPRNYEKAQQCYEQARLLVPHEGNPSHQLAILASYKKDSFASLVHYYRALCVRQPYDTAAENMGTVLSKALEASKSRARRGRDKNSGADRQLPPSVRIGQFKEREVILHALWRVGLEKGVEKMDSIARKHDYAVYEDFLHLVSERHLLADIISNTVVLTQGALWKHRMIRDSGHSRKHESAPPLPGTSTIIEWRILDHIFDIHGALLEVGKHELNEPLPADAAEDDLAQRITATFRRTLPALRIASKWLRANFKYLTQDQEFNAFQHNEKARGVEITKSQLHKISSHSVHTIRFWNAYADFVRQLAHTFPIQNLPSLTAPLEEDVDMRGFLPLKNLMGDSKRDGEKLSTKSTEQVHPNVEQLMRIWDLLEDAKVLVAMENSPLVIFGGHIMFNTAIVEDVGPPTLRESSENKIAPAEASQQQLLDEIRDSRLTSSAAVDRDVDDMTEVTSRTDDDVIRDAFKFLNPEEKDDEDDEIVYMRSPLSPNVTSLMMPPQVSSPKTPVKPITSPLRLSPRSPTHHINQSPFGAQVTQSSSVAPTTAQDLLNDVMGLGLGISHTIGNNLAHTEFLAPQPQLLFGSELSYQPNQSIWAASRDEQPLKYTGSASPSGQMYQSLTYHPPSSQEAPQSIWSSSFPSEIHNSQQKYTETTPSTSYAPAPHSMLTGGSHQRIPSATTHMAAAQRFPSHFQNVQNHPDPLSFPSQYAQPPIRRPDLQHSMPHSYMTSPQIAPGGGPFYGNSAYHTRDPQVNRQFILPPMSQLWSNTG